ncbi:MAG: pilus assembly protein [Fluviicoccus sp.]|uniref:TadE/TadG family type IV pilus assembly protein n=1 Tax=Fluviicoccus sp. TaxID=2003552 RepID=UPI00271D8E4A|nr:TadE family protein [Fluviicoccus sp.]MDO8331311.1 pilus assembly protein [Fluviicoccus sp.]
MHKLLSIHQQGSTLTEFVVVGPLIVLMSMAGLQMIMLQYARLNLDYAGYEAARAGSRHNATPEPIREAWFRALTPMLVTSGALPNLALPEDPRLASGLARKAAMAAEAAFMRIEIISPSLEAFDDFNDPGLQKTLRTGSARAIPNEGLASRSRQIGPTSGVNIQDANVLKLRITYGFEPKIPLVGKLFTGGLALMAGGNEPFKGGLLAAGRIPVVVEATASMVSPPVESHWVKPAPKDHPDQVADPEPDPDAEVPDLEDPGNGTGEGGQNTGDTGTGGSGLPNTGQDDDFCSEGNASPV